MSDKKDYEELEDTLSTEIDEDLDPSKWEDEDDMSLSSDDFDVEDSDDVEDFEDQDDSLVEDDEDEDDHIVTEEPTEAPAKSSPVAKIVLGLGLVTGLGVGGYVGKDIFFPPEPTPMPAFKPAPKVAPVMPKPAPTTTPAAVQAPAQVEAPAQVAAPVTAKPAIAEPVVSTKAPIVASSSKAAEPVETIAKDEVEAIISEKHSATMDAIKSAEERAKVAESRLADFEGEMAQMKRELEEKIAEAATSSEALATISQLEAKQKKVIQLMARINETVKSQVSVNEAQDAKISELEKITASIEEKALKIEDIRAEVEQMLADTKPKIEFEEKPALTIDGNKRALGFNVINSTPDGAMSVLMTPGRKVIVVFEGERVLIDGSVRKVSQIKDDGFTVLFDGGYFVDQNRVEKHEVPAPKKKASPKEESKPKAEEKVTVKEEQKVVEREEFGDLQLVMVIDEHHYMMKTNDGVFVKVTKGDVIEGFEELGDVKGIIADDSAEEPMGILLVGEKYFVKS